MNQFISPHQNININISYNLGQSQQKIPKVFFGKKVAKYNKPKTKEPDSQVKMFKKSQAYVAKPEDRKPTTTKNQKGKKMQQHFFNSQEQFVMPRRLKTEGNMYQQTTATVSKKQQKSSTKTFTKSVWHNKSCSKQNGLTKSVPVKKTVKNLRKQNQPQNGQRNRNNSCILYPTKKQHIMSDVDHVLSMGPEPKSHTKKRASSANIIRGDKFVDKMLNLSVLGSDLGASIPMHDDSAKLSFRNKSKNGALQDFMNSIDMRVLKSMQADQKSQQKKAVLADLFLGEGLQLITFLNKIRRIPMEKLQQKATIIQKFWRKKTSQSVLPYYRNLFRNAALGMQTMHTQDISQIQIEGIESSEHQNSDKFDSLLQNSSSSRKNPNLCQGIDLLRKYRVNSEQKIAQISQQRYVQQYIQSQEEEINFDEKEDMPMKEGEYKNQKFDEFDYNEDSSEKSKEKQGQQEDSSSDLGNQRSLNISKYKQLVRRTIQSTKDEHPKERKQQKKQQPQQNQQNNDKNNKEQLHCTHWNHVHNILSHNINQKAPIISNVVLEELMRQSAYNKQWIDAEFSSDSRKVSNRVSPRGEKDVIIGKKKSMNEYNFKEEKRIFEEQEGEKSNDEEKGQNNEQEGDLQSYNWSKYSDISELKKSDNHVVLDALPKGLPILRNSQNIINSNPTAYRDNSKSNSSRSGSNQSQSYNENSLSSHNNEFDDESVQLKWAKIKNQSAIVNNYLDCGLDNFGLLMKQNMVWHSQNNLQEQYDSIEAQKDNKIQVIHEQNEEDGDILFSNRGEEVQSEGEEKVYIFENQEHAKKNQHRDDTAEHLGNRSQEDIMYPQKQQYHGENNQGLADIILQEQHKQDEISQAVTREINNRRVDKVTQDIIGLLLQQFAVDVSNILRKSQNNLLSQQSRSNRSNEPSAQVNKVSGIITTFQTIRDFITKLKQFILQNPSSSKKVIENLRNNIGPTSMEILSYLRVENEDQEGNVEEKIDEEEDADQWLFVVPNELFENFNKKIIQEDQKTRGKALSNRLKLYTEFWHRSIFQCFNECLDYQRPFGITGAPYTWITQAKIQKKIQYKKIEHILQSAQNRLLQLSCSSSGIIFDKPDSPYRQFGLNEDAKCQLNEQRISRMLANEILDDEYNWITYNDEMTELMVDISRRIEEMLVFQVATDLKKISRRRKILIMNNEDSGGEDQQVVFQIEQL